MWGGNYPGHQASNCCVSGICGIHSKQGFVSWLTNLKFIAANNAINAPRCEQLHNRKWYILNHFTENYFCILIFNDALFLYITLKNSWKSHEKILNFNWCPITLCSCNRKLDKTSTKGWSMKYADAENWETNIKHFLIVPLKKETF